MRTRRSGWAAELPVIERAADRAAGSGDWKRSAALFTTLARNPDLRMSARYFQAVACAKAGDAAGYRAACAGMAERLPRGEPKMSHHESNSAARAATLGPNATNDWTKTLAWTEHALTRLAEIEKARPNLKDLILRERHRFLNTRGAVLYRAGRFEEASKVLREAMQRPLRRERTSQHTIPCPRRSPARPRGRGARSGGRGKKTPCRAQAGERLGAGRDGIAGCGAECRPAASLNVNTTEPRRSTLVITGLEREPR